jgi:hypothetical protein
MGDGRIGGADVTGLSPVHVSIRQSRLCFWLAMFDSATFAYANPQDHQS